MTIGELIKKPEYLKRVAIKFEGQRITYSVLDSMSDNAAYYLKGIGLRKGDKVAIYMQNCPEYIAWYLGIAKAGMISIPINTFLKDKEIAYILRDSGCITVIISEAMKDCINKVKEEIGHITVIERLVPAKETALEIPTEDDVATIIYTSGTTGFPKGVILTHKNLLSNAEACIKAIDITKDDRIILFLPLFHSFAITVCMITPLMIGARIVLLRSVKPFSKVVKALFLDRVSIFVAVPIVYHILSKKDIPRTLLKLLALRFCVSGAAPLPSEVLQSFEQRFKIPLIEGYGLTEASPVVSVNPLKGLRKPCSVGIPLPGIEVKVVGDDGNELPMGEVGELLVKGPCVMLGYYNRPEETAETIRDGWLSTGDLARIDEDGYICIVDRKKDLIITDGMNIYPREIEELLLKNVAVSEAAVVGIKGVAGTEYPKAYIVLKEEAKASEKEIKDFCRESLAPYKVPRQIEFVKELPKGPTGKILKRVLRCR